MVDEQIELLDHIVTTRKEATQMLLEYWHLYSNMGTWQFWAIFIFTLMLPLVVLYFTIDRKKIFHIGFFGLNINFWLTLAGEIGVGHGWWDYPHLNIPFIPIGFTILSSSIPVIFMLVYQWTLNQNKNFYIYALLASIITAFTFAPLMVYLNFFRLIGETNYFHIMLLYIILFLISKLITQVFLFMEEPSRESN